MKNSLIRFLEIFAIVLSLFESVFCTQAIAATFKYDHLNRILCIGYTSGATIEYTYDAFGNRTTYFATAAGTTSSESLAVASGSGRELVVTKPAGAGANYDWYRNGVKIGNTKVPRLSLSPFFPSNAGAYRVIIRETTGAISVVDLTVKLKGLSYESWLQFKEGAAATPKIPGLAKMDSARKDGVENLLKYAFGKGPKEPAYAVLPAATWRGAGASQRLCIKFRRIIDPLDLRVKIEASADMNQWRDVTTLMSMVGTPTVAVDGLSEEVTYECPVTVSQSAAKDWRFLRIAVDGSTPEIEVLPSGGRSLVDGTGNQNLGSVVLGKSATARTFVIRNTGTANLTGLAITKNGSHPSDFVVTAPLKTTLSKNSSTTFTVIFKPTVKGKRTAALRIASNDLDENPFDINLTGTGATPAPEIDVQHPAKSSLVDGKASKSFGTVTIGKSSSAKSFTITNTGTANLTGLAIKKDGKHAADFTVTGPAKATLPPGASTTFKIVFKPSAKNARTAAIHIKSNDADENPFDIKLTGTGIPK